jgi:hypothetical protein
LLCYGKTPFRSTGEVYNSALFIDPVNGHSHTPVYPIYDSDDEEAAKEQIKNIRELPVMRPLHKSWHQFLILY